MESDNPEFLENTFFGKNVEIDSNSEFQINPTPPELHSIVFNSEGSATSDGQTLLDSTTDDIILSGYGNTITIQITPLTGYVKIVE